MTDENAATPKKSLLRTVVRGLMLVVLVAVCAAAAAHFIWKYSGSGQWTQVIAKNGVKVYTRKLRGSVLKDVKAECSVRAGLLGTMAALMESDCNEWMEGCLSQSVVVPFNRKDLTRTDMMVVEYPSPYRTREFLTKAQISQDAKTKAVRWVIRAVPDALPRHRGFYRVEDVENYWTVTPIGNGELQIEFLMHMDQGIPYFLYNRYAPVAAFKLLESMPKVIEPYRNAKVDFVTE